MIYARPGAVFEAMVNNGPTGLVGTLGVRITDPGTQTTSFARTTAGIAEYPAASGIYVANLVAPITPGTFQVVWDVNGAYTAEDLVVVGESEVMPIPTSEDYPPTEDLVAASSVPELSALTSDQQDALRASAIRAVEEYTQQQFVPYTGVITVESPGGGELWLPRRLRSLTSAYASGSDPYELDALRIAPDGYRLVWIDNVVGVGYYEQALMEVSGHDYPTKFPHASTIYVDGDWGWDGVPDDVVQAIRFDMEDQALADANALSATVHVARKLGLESIDQGNLRMQLGAVGALTPRVTRLLDRYVFAGTTGYVV